MNTKAIMAIVGALIVAGIGAVIKAEFATASASAAAEMRVHEVVRRIDEHATKIDELARAKSVLDRIDERTLDMVRRLERVELKVDEQPRRGRGR